LLLVIRPSFTATMIAAVFLGAGYGGYRVLFAFAGLFTFLGAIWPQETELTPTACLLILGDTAV
jgi:hypothetical protein